MADDVIKFFKRQTVDGFVDDKKVFFEVQLISAEAKKYGISMAEIPGTGIFELRYKGITRFFRNAIPYQSLDLAFYSCKDKGVTKNLLQRANIQITKGFIVRASDSVEYHQKVFDALQKPLVLKPSTGHQGQSVYMNVSDINVYNQILQKIFAVETIPPIEVMVEETFVGKEYRILATPNKVIGIVNRVPANVEGDGISTIETLIAKKNSDPRRSDDPNDSLVKIKVDEHILTHLEEQHLSLQTVPSKGEVVMLRQNSNISTGGDSIDVTDDAHPSVIEIALRTMKAIPGLTLGGIDFMTKDITAPQDESSYIIIEVNTSPGFSIHQMPYIGKNRQPAREFLYLMFPELAQDQA